ncbi:MAG: heme biosynthesis protein HemY [Burkholderiales bacterium]|nr:heme biosynthesis protein HemY [Burkholderiales bacterium]
MRGLIWVVLLFVVAVLAATTFGRNDGLVSIFFAGWRTDVSLNFFVLAVLVVCAVLVLSAHALARIVSLPRRAREWREQRKEQAAHAALREAIAELANARYGRARKAAHRALALQADLPALGAAPDFAVIGHLLAANGAHRMQDRSGRQESLGKALAAARQGGSARGLDDGAQLMAAQWALDDHDAEQAMEALAVLSPGAARRTHALHLRMHAARAARVPLQALHMARLLANHQAFSATVAQGLLRALAEETLAQAHDMQQLRRLWQQFDGADRRDPRIAARAARRAIDLGAAEQARQWLRPFWDRLGELERGDREAIALTLAEATDGITSDWLPALESAAQAFGHDSAVLAAVGASYAASGLYGKARLLLEQAAGAPTLPARARRAAWRRLAQMARTQGDEVRAASCDRAAATLD